MPAVNASGEGGLRLVNQDSPGFQLISELLRMGTPIGRSGGAPPAGCVKEGVSPR